MTKYSGGATLTSGHLIGWAAAKLFELGTKQLPEAATPKAVVDGLAALRGDLLPQLTGPFLFSPGKPATPTVCGFAMVIKDKRWTADDVRSCTDYDPTG
jgi:hypothetical protein